MEESKICRYPDLCGITLPAVSSRKDAEVRQSRSSHHLIADEIAAQWAGDIVAPSMTLKSLTPTPRVPLTADSTTELLALVAVEPECGDNPTFL